MPLNDEQWEDLLAHLNGVAEKSDPEGIGKLIDSPEEFVRFLRSEWDDVILPGTIRGAAKRRDLAQLKSTRAAMDNVAVRKKLDDRIKELER